MYTTAQHSTETYMYAKAQLKLKNNLDSVGEYVAHMHKHTLTHQYLTQLYINSVRNSGKESTNICVFLAHGRFSAQVS